MDENLIKNKIKKIWKLFKDNLNKINCNMEDYLNTLDKIYNNFDDIDNSCCNNLDNHSISQEKISCYN